MVKTKIKRAVSFVMATVLSLSAFMSIGTSTAFAASGEKTNVYMVDFDKLQKMKESMEETQRLIEVYEANIDYLKEYYVKLLKKCDYLEIQHHPNSQEQKEYNILLYKYAKKYNKKLIAATDTHSINSYEAECRSLLRIDKYKKDVDEEEDFEKNFDLVWKTYDELVDSFKQQGALPEEVYLQAIENTNLLLEQIEDFKLDTTFPQV